MGMTTGICSVYIYQLINLRKNNVSLCIFLNGKMIESYPEIHKRLAERIIQNRKLGDSTNEI